MRFLLAGILLLAQQTKQQEAEKYYKSGNEKFAKSAYQSASADYSQAIALDPKKSTAYSARAACSEQTGQLDGALKDAEKALELQPLNAQGHLVRGRIRLTRRDPACKADLTRTIELDPLNPDAQALMGYSIILLGGEHTQARQNFQRAIQLYGATAPDAGGLALRGIARHWIHEFDSALQDLTAALKINPRNGAAYYHRANCHFVLGKTKEAESDFQKAISYDTKYIEAYAGQAHVVFRNGQWKEAAVAYRKACDRDKDNQDNLRPLLWLALLRNSEEQAAMDDITAYLAVRKPTPDDPWFSKVALFLQRKVEEKDMFEAAVTGGDRRSQERFLLTYYYAGVRRLLKGEQKEAFQYFKTAVSAGIKDRAEHIFAAVEVASPGGK